MIDYFGPVFPVGAGIAGGIAGAFGASDSTDVGAAAAGVASGILGAGKGITDSEYLGNLGTAVGAQGALLTGSNLPGQVSKMQGSLDSYNYAVASGNSAEITASGLQLASDVSTVLTSISSIVSAAADVAVAVEVGGDVAAGMLGGMTSVGLGIGALGGLFSLAANGASAVMNAIKNAGDELSHLVQQMSNHQDGNPGTEDGNPSTDEDTPPTGAGPQAMGKYDDGRNEISPLVLDLTGRGINLTPLSWSSPYFDLANDGFARQTGWVGPETGILCFDPDDRDITNISQLFGNSTTDGFDILRALDTNHDNVIDTKDVAFENLRVWIDGNGDAITEAGELHTLADLGIV
jgi:hypothetical protein